MFTVVVLRPGDSAVELTPRTSSVRFSSAAVGGFGSASFAFDGMDIVAKAHRLLPFLSKVQVRHGSVVLWEGRIEDRNLDIGRDIASVSVSAFGYRRVLEETSAKRVWLLRSFAWQPTLPASGLDTVAGVTPVLDTGTMFVTTGQFDPSDLSRVGVLADNYSGGTPGSGDANWAVYRAPSGVYMVKLYALAHSLSTGVPFAQESSSGSSWNTIYGADSNWTDVEAEFENAEASLLMLGSRADGVGGNNGSWEDIRLLCTAVDEDMPGGIFGGTILRDLLALVPGLSVGVIEDGNEFLIPAIARAVRDSAMSVVEEVSSYYRKEWSVWEDQEFSWKGFSDDSVHWALPLSLVESFNMKQSVGEVTKETFMLYEDAATGVPKEESYESADQRNPYVKTGQTKDVVMQAPVVMTSSGAQALAQRVNDDTGLFPIAAARITLPAVTEIDSPMGQRRMALHIRGGENIVLPDLPKTEILRQGRDGETFFRIVRAETDMATGITTLECDAYSKSSDVLLARLAAVTRVVTG